MKNKFLIIAGTIIFAGLSLASISNIAPNKVNEVKADFTPVSVSEYYKNINSSMKGDTLKVALYNIIKGHTRRSYNTLEHDMKYTDRNWEVSPDPNDENPIMWLLYADYNNDTSKRSDFNHFHGGGSNGGVSSGYVWNKEHIWARINGVSANKSGTAYEDLHHLRASDEKLNNTRSNHPFANGGSYTENHYGTKSECKFSGSTFEPADEYKGDVARALFYMATRYYNGDGSDANLTLTTGTDSTGGKWGYLDTLLSWHELDPVDNFEIHRNQLIYEDFQHNRNPYIDHPEYARAVFKNEPIVEPKKLTNLVLTGSPTQTTYKEGASFNPNGLTITAYYDDNSNSNVTSSITWEAVTSSSVTGTYTYGSDSLQVTVNGLTVEHINGLTYTGTPTKTTYNAGDNFDPTGLTVRATYTGGSSEVVTSQVTWSPSPLTYGTGSVIGTLGEFSITIPGITVNNVVSQDYTIKFKDATNDVSGETSDNNIKNLIASGAENVSSISNSSKVYQGKTGLKLGSSSVIGKFTINLADSAKVAASKIKVGVKRYNTSDDPTLYIETNVDSKQSVSAEADLSEKEVTLSGQNISTITISSKKRVYLSYITVVSQGSSDVDPIQTWIDGYMHMDDPNYSGLGTGLCISQNTYVNAKKALLSLQSQYVESFENNEDNKYTNALKRYLAWAKANLDEYPFETNYAFVSIHIENVYNSNQKYIIVIVVASIILMSGATLLLLRKKRK